MKQPTNALQIGIVTSGVAREAEQLEARGVDSLWIGGHLSSRNPSPEVVVGLTRLATVTERAKVGSSILLLPLYPPAIIAKQIADLDRASGGRIVLGVGVGGEYPQEFRAVEVPMEERGRRTDEIIPLLRRLWTAEEITHEGRYFTLRDVRIHPAPMQADGPPIVVAGRKEVAMRRAALLGDGWFPYLFSARRYGESVAVIKQTAEQAGRDLDGFEWCVWVFVNINPDGDLARSQAARAIGGSYSQDLGSMIDRVAAAGTASEVSAKLCAFYDAGARHFVFMPAAAGAEQQPVLDRLFDEVLPALREHAGDAGTNRSD